MPKSRAIESGMSPRSMLTSTANNYLRRKYSVLTSVAITTCMRVYELYLTCDLSVCKTRQLIIAHAWQSSFFFLAVKEAVSYLLFGAVTLRRHWRDGFESPESRLTFNPVRGNVLFAIQFEGGSRRTRRNHAESRV